MPFFVSSQRRLTAKDFLHIYNTDPIQWGLVDRWVREEPDFPEPPSYTLYTGFSLANYFIFFFLITMIQAVPIFFMKRVTAPSFKKAGLFKQLVHSLENTNIPLPFKDWDVGSCTVEEHRARMMEIVKEVVATFIINKVIGLMMLLPLIWTG